MREPDFGDAAAVLSELARSMRVNEWEARCLRLAAETLEKRWTQVAARREGET